MKRFLLMAVVAMMTIMSARAQKQPAGMRMEVAESERDKSEYTIFTYMDDDETFGYYLGLGRVTELLSIFRDDITDMSVANIRETCIWLGATSDEAFATIDTLLALFDREVDTTVEFRGRAATDSDRLGESNISTCIVKKKTVGGKRLLFIFACGKHEAHTYLTKSVLKELRTEFKLDKKLHPKQHR